MAGGNSEVSAKMDYGDVVGQNNPPRNL